MTNRGKYWLLSLAASLAVWGAVIGAGSMLAQPAQAQTSNGAVSVAAPSYTAGTAKPLSLDTSGNLRVLISGGLTGTDISSICGVALSQDSAAAGVTCPLPVGGVYNATPPTYTSGDRTQWQAGPGGELISNPKVSSAALVDGLSNTINGVALVSNTGTLALSTYRTLGAVYNGSTWDRVRGDTNGQAVWMGTTASNVVGTASSVTAAAAGSIVAKASAGNFYGANLTTGATAGVFMLFNATAAPADGAVTPFGCWQMAANSTLAVNNNPPLVMNTGITMVFSTGTNCFSKTASATAFMRVDYR